MATEDLDRIMLGNLLSPEQMIKKLLPIEMVLKIRVFRTTGGEVAVTFKEVEEAKDANSTSET